MADAKISGLDLQHISSNLSNYEAARTSFFDFIIDMTDKNGVFVDKLFNTEASEAAKAEGIEVAADSDVVKNIQENIRLSVVKCDFVPHFSLEVLEYKRGNEKIKFAGVPTFKDGNIVVEDFVGLNTKSILMAWQALAYDVNTRKGGRMADYKRNCTLVEYTQDYEQIRSWNLYGCWISEINEDGFDKENDGKRQITAKIEYDRAEMIMPKEAQ